MNSKFIVYYCRIAVTFYLGSRPRPDLEKMADRWLRDIIKNYDDKLNVDDDLEITKDMSHVRFNTNVESIPTSRSEVHFTVTDSDGDTVTLTGRMDEIIRHNAQYKRSCTEDGTIITPGSYDPQLGESNSTMNANGRR